MYWLVWIVLMVLVPLCAGVVMWFELDGEQPKE
jgi:hypothetical protein